MWRGDLVRWFGGGSDVEVDGALTCGHPVGPAFRDGAFRAPHLKESDGDWEYLQFERPLVELKWAAGFGPTDDPFLADLLGASFLECRARLVDRLTFWASRMALGVSDAVVFRCLAEDVARLTAHEQWHRRARTAHHDLTFWLLPADDAISVHGARLKSGRDRKE